MGCLIPHLLDLEIERGPAAPFLTHVKQPKEDAICKEIRKQRDERRDDGRELSKKLVLPHLRMSGTMQRDSDAKIKRFGRKEERRGDRRGELSKNLVRTHLHGGGRGQK